VLDGLNQHEYDAGVRSATAARCSAEHVTIYPEH
jgi:hypothetical protein